MLVVQSPLRMVDFCGTLQQMRSYKIMEFTEAKFTDETKGTIFVRIDGVAISIPVDSQNRHYKAILEWVAEGNTIEE